MVMFPVSRSRVERRRGAAQRPTALAFAAAFGGYLVVGAALSAVSPPHPVGIGALVAVAAVTGWFGSAPGALGVGAMGWFFYSGFVAHAHAQLGVTGIGDLYVALALVGAALAASSAHAVLTPRCASR